MSKDILEQIEEEFDFTFPVLFVPDPEGGAFSHDVIAVQDKVKSFLKSSIIKVLEQLMEREEKEIEHTQKHSKGNYADGIVESKQDTIANLKSKIAKLSTNIDKE